MTRLLTSISAVGLLLYVGPIASAAEPNTIVKATYGAGSRQKDVTEVVRRYADAKRTLPVLNSTFGGDPAPNQRKELVIQYKDDGKLRVVRYAEDSKVDWGAAFKGAVVGEPPKDGASFRGHRYLAIRKMRATWKEADTDCRARGGYLAVVTSEKEHEFIAKLAGKSKLRYYWLGQLVAAALFRFS